VAESFDKKYSLAGKCKWTAGENGDRLLYELKEKAGKLSPESYGECRQGISLLPDKCDIILSDFNEKSLFNR
jgi:hypothetical protein